MKVALTDFERDLKIIHGDDYKTALRYLRWLKRKENSRDRIFYETGIWFNINVKEFV